MAMCRFGTLIFIAGEEIDHDVIIMLATKLATFCHLHVSHVDTSMSRRIMHIFSASGISNRPGQAMAIDDHYRTNEMRGVRILNSLPTYCACAHGIIGDHVSMSV